MIDLYTAATPNGWKINPNGRIPAIVDRGRSLVMQWLMFQMAGIGPMMGQANVFLRYAPEKIPYAIDRYQREVRRLFEVLERQLATHEYVAGEEYSIADIDGLPHLARWMKTIGERPAVQRGRAVPPPGDIGEKDKTTVDTGRKILV